MRCRSRAHRGNTQLLPGRFAAEGIALDVKADHPYGRRDRADRSKFHSSASSTSQLRHRRSGRALDRQVRRRGGQSTTSIAAVAFRRDSEKMMSPFFTTKELGRARPGTQHLRSSWSTAGRSTSTTAARIRVSSSRFRKSLTVMKREGRRMSATPRGEPSCESQKRLSCRKRLDRGLARGEPGRCWSWCSAPRFLDEQEPLRELLARYPQAKVIGCSGR